MDNQYELKKEWAKNNPEKIKLSNEKWRKNHPERRKEIAKKWADKNKERTKIKNAQRYLKEKDKIRKRTKLYAQNNKEKVNAISRRWRKKNPEKIKELRRNWEKFNYDKRRLFNRKRRNLKLGASGFHTQGEWETLKAQYNWTCPCCNRSEPEIKLTEDHIIPLSKGGSDNIENIQPLCQSCNSRKNIKVIKF